MVAKLLDVWLHLFLLGNLLCPLLHHKVGHSGLSVYVPLLWIYISHGFLLLLTHRNNWFPGLFLVCEENLQCGQSGLKDQELVIILSALYTQPPRGQLARTS